MSLGAGMHTMTAEAYHADPCAEPSLSSSLAQVLLTESPYKAWWSHPKLNPDFRAKHEDKFDIGTASHAMLLENDATKIVIVEADDWRTKAAREARDAANAAGKTALLARHSEAVRRMVEIAKTFIAKSEIAEYWSQAESEQTIIWRESGVWLRCRIDRRALNARCLIDYKSTTDASPEAFSRQIVRMGYHFQDAFYRRGERSIGSQDPAFVFLAQSTEPPHECSLHACDPALREIADLEVEHAIALWADCLTKKRWPSHGGRIHWAIPSAWQMTQHEQRLQEAA